MEENTHQQPKRPACPGDCTGCNIYQRNFCSSQLGHTNMNILMALIKEVSEIHSELKTVSSELAASHSQPADELINPLSD